MRGTRITTLKLICLLTLLASAALAAAPDYFPLRSGNSWAYRVSQGRVPGRSGAVNVGELVNVDGRQYFRLQFFDQELLVRQVEDGSIVALDAQSKSERTWLPLGAAEGQSLETSFDPCARTAAVRSRAAKVKTDAGEFENALEIRYEPGCADAGTTVQYFLPYVGLVSYETTSIAGPVRYELLYSRTGATNIDTRTNALTMALDAAVYKAGQSEEGTARLTLRASEPVKLTFPSGQSTELRITNEKGETVYVWSADKAFILIYRPSEMVGPGEKTWLMSFPVGQLPAGKYTAEGRLTTEQPLYSASLTFEVR